MLFKQNKQPSLEDATELGSQLLRMHFSFDKLFYQVELRGTKCGKRIWNSSVVTIAPVMCGFSFWIISLIWYKMWLFWLNLLLLLDSLYKSLLRLIYINSTTNILTAFIIKFSDANPKFSCFLLASAFYVSLNRLFIIIPFSCPLRLSIYFIISFLSFNLPTTFYPPISLIVFH